MPLVRGTHRRPCFCGVASTATSHQHLHHHGHQADDQHGAKQSCYIGDNPAATNAATKSNS